MGKKKAKYRAGKKNRQRKTAEAQPDHNRKDWEFNQENISEAFFMIANSTGKFPSYKSIADKCNVSEKTVERHLKSLNFEELKMKCRSMTDKVLLKTVAAALSGNHQDRRLYYEVVEDLGVTKKIDHTSGGEKITALNVAVINDATKKDIEKLR